MHVEVQVALNFVISYLYNKLPRRRVNLFGEELEKALKDKFKGHWYPEKPFKGSAFRCLKTEDPIDAVLDRAAKESGIPIADILEYLPCELAVWVDPGEVSYRIGEKGAVKILYSESNRHDESYTDREVTKTFNPEAQCFRPIESINTALNALAISPKCSPQQQIPQPAIHPMTHPIQQATKPTTSPTTVPANGTGPIGPVGTTPSNNNLKVQSPAPCFLSRSQAQLTFTTATFAQTKFGSTKLKSNSKRANRMSPTEFSNYIKQRAMQQQQIHYPHGTNGLGSAVHNGHLIGPSSPSRSISPNAISLAMQDPYFIQPNGLYNNGVPTRNSAVFDPVIQQHFPPTETIGPPFSPYYESGNFYGRQSMPTNSTIGSNATGNITGSQLGSIDSAGTQYGNGKQMNGLTQSVTPTSVTATTATATGSGTDATTNLLDGFNTFSGGHFQHLLVAN